MTLEIFVGRELPAWSLFWEDGTGQPVDLSAGYTFTVAIRRVATDTAIAGTVAANATPTSDTGSSDDVPTLSFAPDVDELDELLTGPATVIVVATETATGKDRERQWPAIVKT